MDLSGLQDLIPDVAKLLNVDPATALFWLGLLATGCNIAGRLIPDDKTGWLGSVRDVCKVLGLYAPNRVTSGVSVSDVAKAVVANRVEDVKREVIEHASDAGALIPGVVEQIVEDKLDDVLELAEDQIIVPAFPGLLKGKGNG